MDLKERRIRWRAKSHKIGHEHITPITQAAVEALRFTKRQRPVIGDGCVLPSPADPERPCSRHIMRDWWERVRKQAGLEGVRYLGWHSLRRKFATDLKSTTPLKDLCHLGGWIDHNTVLKCYQQPDEATMREALYRRNAV